MVLKDFAAVTLISFDYLFFAFFRPLLGLGGVRVSYVTLWILIPYTYVRTCVCVCVCPF